MMMILLWILSAQPLVFAIIFAIRARRHATRMEAKRRMDYRPSLPARSENSVRLLAAEAD